MITYAESIMKPDAQIAVDQIAVSMLCHRQHAETEIAAGRYKEHTSYDQSGQVVVNKNFRDSKTIIPKDDGNLALEIYNRVSAYADKTFNLVPGDMIIPATIELFAYPPGIGIGMHIDDHVANLQTGEVIARDEYRGITSILYVNDDFEGGEICFPDQNLIIKPKPGLFVLFPSNRKFRHAVKPITAGTRYSYQRMYSILDGRKNRLSVVG